MIMKQETIINRKPGINDNVPGPGDRNLGRDVVLELGWSRAGAGLEWEIKRVAGPVFPLQPPPARCQLLFIATDLSPRVSFLHPPAPHSRAQAFSP